MKIRLLITRQQADVKGMLGGHKGVNFTLSYKLELTPDELQLVERYKLSEYPLTCRRVQGVNVPDDTLGLVLQGRSQTVSDVITLVKNEQIIKEACDALPPLFNIVRTFGGTEAIEYPRESSISSQGTD